MFVIGLTGSIAMGKTTTARLFAEEGVPVHDADAAVHRLYEGEAAALIEAAFPGTVRDGKVDRVALGRQVVGNPPALRRLEQIVHPLVRLAETKFLQEAERAGAPIVVLDIPLLFETGSDNRVDATVVVSAPAEMQRARVLERGVSLERLEALLARQTPDTEKRQRADFVVDSGQGIERARDQVRRILAAVAKMPNRHK
jgi:dephospho-CoA kinase